MNRQTETDAGALAASAEGEAMRTGGPASIASSGFVAAPASASVAASGSAFVAEVPATGAAFATGATAKDITSALVAPPLSDRISERMRLSDAARASAPNARPAARPAGLPTLHHGIPAVFLARPVLPVRPAQFLAEAGDGPGAPTNLTETQSALGVEPTPPIAALTGLMGQLSMEAADSLDEEESVHTLERLHALMGWVQAQQALVIRRIEKLMARRAEDAPEVAPKDRPVEAFDLTASEVGAVLRLPHVSALRVVAESEMLVHRLPNTLARLADGRITYGHARVIMDEIRYVPTEDGQAFEVELLDAAKDRTAAQLGRKARLMRERRYPETIPVRHRDALDKRRVMLDAAPDGMACLTAILAAEKAQAMFNRLTAEARRQRDAGDARTQDQLRADLLAAAILGRSGPHADPTGRRTPPAVEPGEARLLKPDRGPGVKPDSGADAPPHGLDEAGVPEEDLPGMRTELMVVINAETLFGVGDDPAELNGYGPISSDAARRLIRSVTHWTGLVQDPSTGEILAVGRRRKVPAGLARWLQARDGTCRFPGCSVNALRPGVEIDHTVPYSRGGATEHGNLEHLCAKHHRLKTQGFWKAKQTVPGELEWLSPLARRYGTEPQLQLRPPKPEGRKAATGARIHRPAYAGGLDSGPPDERPPEPPPPF